MWLHRYPATLGCADNQVLRRKRRLTVVVGHLAICNLLGGLWLSPIDTSLCGIQALS